ncbi:hypothetical protein D3C73_1526720 [compost metagenome]
MADPAGPYLAWVKIHSIALSTADGPIIRRKRDSIALCTAESRPKGDFDQISENLLHEMAQNNGHSIAESAIIQQIPSEWE